MSESLVVVENLGKKFCRNLKRSLWYGIRDIGSELVGRKRHKVKLRKQEFWALQDVNFEIRKGELVGLIGANGAGKTTLLKLLSGLVKPDKGRITIRGKIQALIALNAGFNPILTGRENVYINGAVLGFSKKEMDGLMEEILNFSEIGEFIDMPVQSYSSGMQVRLGFAVAVNLKPDILIVDEVLAVGDAAFRRKARKKMMDLLHSGISVLFVSHNMALVSSLTSRCIYLDKGKIVSSGASEEVTSHYLRDAIKRSQVPEEEGPNRCMAAAYHTTPDFVLKSVVTGNAGGKETMEFKTHDAITLRFKMQFYKKITRASFAFGVRDQVDDVVIGFSKTIPEQENYDGPFELECTVPNNNLREGIYNIGFYAADFNGGALFKSNNVMSFTILADMATIETSGSTQGYIVLDTSWRILSTPINN
ncbi:MAG: ABC transporter ATP-binding protein [bacterium]|nr:ABC transporter ATP-binding protein [bacterium]